MWRERGYPSRSEFVRDVLRDAAEPTLTDDALRELISGFEDVREGRTAPLDEVSNELSSDTG